MERTFQITETDLESLLVRAARLGAAEFRQELDRSEVKPMMSKSEIAAYLGKSVPTINRYMAEGMPYEKKNNEHPRFYRREVDNWIKTRA